MEAMGKEGRRREVAAEWTSDGKGDNYYSQLTVWKLVGINHVPAAPSQNKMHTSYTSVLSLLCVMSRPLWKSGNCQNSSAVIVQHQTLTDCIEFIKKIFKVSHIISL